MKTLHTPHTHFSRCTGVCFINQCPGDTVQTGTGKVDPARKFKWTTTARAQSTLMICVFFLTVKNINIWRFWIRVSNRNSVVRNCTQLFSNCAFRSLHGSQLCASKIHLRWKPYFGFNKGLKCCEGKVCQKENEKKIKQGV